MTSPELAGVEIEEISRSSFLLKGVMAVGAVYGTTMVAPFVKKAFSQEAAGGGGDVGILNFALTLEYLEAAFYEQALAEAPLDSKAKELATLIQGDEQQHVEGLSAAIEAAGAKPVAAPGVDFGKSFADQTSFLKLAQVFEDTGVSAYNGAGPAIKDKATLGTAGSIVQVEARHAAAIRLLNGETPSPAAFDATLEMDEVLAAVQPYVKG